MYAEGGMAGLEESAQRGPLAVVARSFEPLRLPSAGVPGLPNPEEGESAGSQRPSKDTSTCSVLFSTLCRITVVVDADGRVPPRCSCVVVAFASGRQAGSAAAKGLVSPFWSLEEGYS